MKTKIYLVALATLVLGAVFFTACSTDGENKEETNTKELNSVKYKITNGTAFISEFYGTSSWSEGKNITVTDSLMTYKITEIIIKTDTRARGYLIEDNTTGGLLYFADVDRSKYILKAVDLVTEEQEIITNINTNPNYSITDGFDFIKIIDGGDYDYVAYGYYTYGTCVPSNVGAGCYAGVYYQKTFLGIKIGGEKAVQEISDKGNLVNATTPCDCSTGVITPYKPK